MGEYVASTLPALGIALTRKEARIRNRSGADRLRGHVLMFDLRLSVATNYKIGDPDSAFVVCITPVAADDGFGFYCLLLEDIKDGQLGRALLWGVDEGRFTPGQEPTSHGLTIGPNASSVELDGLAFTAGAKVTGFSMDFPIPAPSGLMKFGFNGIYGLGKG